MNTVADDLHEPDEARPAKRARLEAPLDVTEDVEEEMIDDEDLYGTDGDGEAASRAVIDEPDLKASTDEDVAHGLPNSVNMVGGGEQAHFNGLATPMIESGEATDTEDLYGDGKAKTAGGLPAEAIDHGEDDFVAPPQHVAGEDGVEVAMMEETTQTEAEPPVESDDLGSGAQEASTDAAEQQKEVMALQTGVEPSSNVDEAWHAAPARTRTAEAGQAEKGTAGDVNDDDDILGSLELALKANSAAAAADILAGGAPPSAAKAKDDPEFLEAAAKQKDDASAEWQFDSSDAESSSDDSSDSSDSDSDSDSDSEGGYEMLDAETAAKILMAGEGDDDDGKEKGQGKGGPRTHNEVKDDVVPKPDVKVTEDMKITLLGIVERTVENLVLVRGATPGEYQVVESGSVLCNASREVIGAVFETLGKVQQPMYSIAFTNATEIEDMGLQFGTQIYYVDSHSTFVFTQPLKNMKGTDASNIHDEEVGEDEIEFSDDEKEAEYKRQKKAAKRGGRGGLTRTDFNSDRGGMRSFGAPGHDSRQTFVGGGASDAPQTSYGGGMSYDDDDVQDDFYQPLKRPDNLSELMAGAPPPPPPSRGGFDRGRGRGRGRGDRGRGDRGRGRGGFQQRGQHQGSPPRDSARGGHGQNGQRGGSDQANGHRGNAHSFPDRHNKHGKNKGRGNHALPPKPPGQQSPTPPQSSPQQQNPQYYQPYQQAQPPVPQPPMATSPQQQAYQFNGYTFQYGNPPPPPQYQQPAPQPQQYYPQQNYQQHSPTQQQSPGAPQFPAGAYVNPTFWAGQQQQGQAQQYGAWPQPQQQQYGQGFGQAQAQGQQPNNLADILRALGGQGQGQR